MEYQEVRAQLQQAIEAKRVGDYETSRAIYRHVAEELPDEADAYKGLAKVEITSGNYECALQALMKWVWIVKRDVSRVNEWQRNQMQDMAWDMLQEDAYRGSIIYGHTKIPEGFLQEIVRKDSRAHALLIVLGCGAADLFAFVGHCLYRMFPEKFSPRIPESLLDSLEDAVGGRLALGPDERYTNSAPLVYVSGFLFVLANVDRVRLGNGTIPLNYDFVTDRPQSEFDLDGIKIMIDQGDLAGVKQVVVDGFDVNAPVETENYVEWARNSSAAFLQMMAQAIGGDTSGLVTAPIGETMLIRSIFKGQTDIACWLLEAGADPNKSLVSNGRSPLITAAGVGDLQVVARLLSAGANVDYQMHNGCTALMYAVSKGNVTVTNYLLANGASRDIRDADGWTVADYAAKAGIRI